MNWLDNLTGLPPELIPIVLSRLQDYDRVVFSQTCSTGRQLVNRSVTSVTITGSSDLQNLPELALHTRFPNLQRIKLELDVGDSDDDESEDGKSALNDGICAEFLAMSAQQMLKLKELDMRRCRGITSAGIGTLPLFCAHLQKVHLEDMGIKAAGVLALAALPELKVLHLHDCHKLSDTAIQLLSAATSLHTLSLDNSCIITDEGIKALSTLTSLQSLDLCDTAVQFTSLQDLNGLTNLTSLNLAGCEEMAASSIVGITKLQSIKTLDLSWVSNGVYENLHHLTNLQHLTELVCLCDDDTGVDMVCRNLPYLTQLKSLSVNQVTLESDGLLPCLESLSVDYWSTSPSFHFSPKLTNIAVLDRVQEDDLSGLHRYTLLHCLRLEECALVADKDIIKHISIFGCLQELHLRDLPMLTNEGCTALAQLHQLTQLRMSKVHRVTDIGLLAFHKLKNLKSITLHKFQCITYVGVTYIALCKGLNVLNVFECKKVDVAQCREALQIIDAVNLNWTVKSKRGKYDDDFLDQSSDDDTA